MESIITQIVRNFKIQGSAQQPSLQPLRTLIDKFFYFIVFILSILIAFFAGRSVKFMENKVNYSYEVNASQGNNLTDSRAEKSSTGANVNVSKIVASKGGKKYYYVWCKAASNILEKNKRYFADEDAAKKAGLTLAASCK